VPFHETATDTTGKPKGYFRLLMNESQAQTALASLRTWNLGITALVLGLASILAWFASQFIVRPILALVTSARLIAKGDLTQRADVATGDEIGSLAEAFNAMASDLEKTVKNLMQSQAKLKSVVETVTAARISSSRASTNSAPSSTRRTTPSISSTAASARSPTTSKRSPRHRRRRRRRCWRWWRRWKRSAATPTRSSPRSKTPRRRRIRWCRRSTRSIRTSSI
jgi:methyl-accepting chemotaxis protein